MASDRGESDLDVLLGALSPRLNDGAFVFTRISGPVPAGANPVVTVQEQEGLTMVLPQQRADTLGLPYRFVAAWITLEVHSALEAVGLTAAVSRALADVGISANVVAGYAHDHIFVPIAHADMAMRALGSLSSTCGTLGPKYT